MATQIKVNSSTGNITVQLSRGVIGPSTTANVANTAYNLDAATTANVVIGGGVNGYVLSTDGLGVTSWVAQTGGGGSAPGGANTQIQYNDAGTLEGDATFSFNNTTDVVSASHFSGEAGNLSNIQGANVSGAVANASHAVISDSANSVALANVVGAGNIASINIDGNVSNVLRGDGTFSADTTDYSNSNVVSLMNAFGSNTINTTGNVDTGNLSATTSLFVDGTSGNVLIEPNVAFDGKTYSSLTRGEYNTGTGNSTTGQAFITDNYTTQGVTNLTTFANTAAGQTAGGPSLSFNNYAAIGNANTDPLVAGQITFTSNPDGANLANVSTGTVTTMSMGGPGSDGFLTTIGSSSTDAFGKAAWKQFQYRPRAMEFFRRGGDADAREGVVANDETSLNFYMASNNAGGGSSWESYPAVIAGKADPAFSGADNAVVPTGLEFQVTTAAFDRFNHTMYANGDVVFNSSAESFNPSGPNEPVTVHGNGLVTANAFTATTGNITATAGQFVGDGGGLSNISVAAGTSIVNGTSNVSVALDGNVTAGIGGTADMLVLSTDGANVKNKVFIDNADGNVLLDPNVAFNSDTFTNITRGEYDSGASLSSLNTAIVTDNYAGTGEFSQIMYANTAAGQIAQGPKITLEDKSTIGNTNTDPFVHSSVSFSAAAPTSNLAASTTLTHSTVTLDGNLTIDTGSNLQTTGSQYQTATIQQYQYQNRAIEFYRRGGNAESLAGVAADDEVALVSHMGSGLGGGVAFNSYSGKIAFKVDSAWVDPGDASLGVPQGIEFKVTDTSYAQLYHNMYANGTVRFNSNGPGTAVTIGSNGVITGDGGGLSNVSATATPGGFNDTIQFNNGGTLDGNASFQFFPGTSPLLQLQGTSGSQPADLSLENGVLTMYTEDLSGGKAPFSFTFHNDLSGFVEPINYKRTRGTRSAPTAVQAGDTVKSERMQVYSGSANFTTQNTLAGTFTSVIQANDGLGNVATTTTISTALPANGPNALDKIDLDTEFVTVHGNIQMDNTSASFVAGRIRQITDTFSNLTASPVTGERAVITDGPSLPATFGTVVSAGGGTQVMPVFWDGSNWRMG